ncbi:hypothetical protein KY348_03440 [Candidatus Woesearchaeota archaeon]|nr:hypothetical protein [Candidatus Woesearchaeota archaeon]
MSKNVKEKIFNRKTGYNILIILLIGTIGALLIMPLIYVYALTGNYSTTSPFSCGSNCNNGYELSGHNATYCYNNPVDCYNTIDECRDGTNDGFEFVNNIYVQSLNGTNFTGNHTINVTVEFDCDSDGDTITISYHNGTSFRVIQDDTCSVSALVNKTYSFVLDETEGNHTVRAAIVYMGGTQMICGYSYDTTFSDTDDVTFFVYQGPDTENPQVLGVSPVSGTAYNQSYGLAITISANVTDNENVSNVQALVEWESYNYTLNLSFDSGTLYSGNFTNITELTRYNVTILANDTSNNMNNTEITYFTINSTTNITITAPSNKQVLPYEDTNLRFTIDYGYNTDTAMYSFDGGANITVNDKLSVAFTQSDQNGTIGEPDNVYDNLSMSFKPNENMSIEIVSLNLKRNGSGTNDSKVQIRTNNGGKPSNTILASGNVTNTSVSINYTSINITLNTTINLTVNTTYWLFLTPNGSTTDFYTWEASNDGLYSDGNYSNNNSLDLLFVVYDQYKYNTIITNVSKGVHRLIVYANSTSMSSIKSQLIQFEVDNKSPSIGTITYSPNTPANVDPNVLINVSVNVSDEVEISQVLLQYKQSNGSSFTNTSMQNISGLYNGNFTPDSENNWTFRIYARDSSNNTAYSDNTTINVSYEYLWNSTLSNFNTTSAFLDTNTSVGNITINNTADINLTINISKTSSTVPSIYFNNTEGSLVFNVSPGSTTIIEVIATGQSIESEQTVGIRIDPSQSNANPDYLSTNFTLISYVSGPYLDVDISEYDSTVTQGQTRVTLTAAIINVGNETANNVSAYWTLPSRWTPKTNITSNYTTLSVGQQVSFTRYVDIDSDAATGTQTIRIDVNCSEGKDDYEQRSISVNSSGEGGEETPRSGSGGGGGIIPSKTTRLEISTSEEVEIERGANQTITGILSNTGDTDLENLSMLLEGFPLVHYKIEPDFLSKLRANTSKSFSLFINIPEYFGSGKHNAVLVIKALAESAWKEFSRDITIIVITDDKTQASECFEKAGLKIDELVSTRMGTTKLSQRLDEAKRNYNSKNYGDANNLCKEILKEAELAMNVKEQIDSINNAYSGLGREIPEFSELIKLTQEAFEREDYGLASRRIEQAGLLLSMKEKEVQQTLAYKWGLIRKYWKEIIMVLVLIIIIGILTYTSTSLSFVSKRFRALKEHEDVVRKKIKQVQRKYFVEKLVPSRLYEKEMELHRSALANIESQKTNLKLKKLRLERRNTLEELEKAEQEAEAGKKELQTRYFVEKSIDKKTFKRLTLGFDRILQDIKRRIALKKRKRGEK